MQKKDQLHKPTGQGEAIPVAEEEVRVTKRMRTTGVTRVKKTVEQREEIVDEPLLREEVQIERIPVNRFVEKAFPVRHEDDTILYRSSKKCCPWRNDCSSRKRSA